MYFYMLLQTLSLKSSLTLSNLKFSLIKLWLLFPKWFSSSKCWWIFCAIFFKYVLKSHLCFYLWLSILGTSLMLWWLRLHAPNAGGLGLIPGQGTKIPHCGPKKKKKKSKKLAILNCQQYIIVCKLCSMITLLIMSEEPLNRCWLCSVNIVTAIYLTEMTHLHKL